jgi:PhnB protein
MPAKAIPEGFHTVTPYLTVHGVAKLMDFLKQAFDAKEIERMPGPDGKIGHAQMKIGDSMIMMGEAMGQWGPMPASLYLYVPDTDALYKRAIQAGATSVMEPADQFYGDRNAGVKDSSGNLWWIATHKEDVPADELKNRAEQHIKKMQAQAQKEKVQKQHGA